MSAAPVTFASRFARVMGVGVLAATIALGLGYYPTVRLGGPEAVPAMFAGCVIAMLAGWIGAIPICLSGDDPRQAVNRMLGATALRMAAAVVLTVSAALSGWFELRALLIWVAIAYLFTLAGETIYLMRMLKAEGPDR